MATTLAAIVSTMQEAVQTVTREDGTQWLPQQGPEGADGMSAPDAELGFRFDFPDDRRALRATGVGAIQMVTRRVHLSLHAGNHGDVSLDMAKLDDDARAVGDAVELATYPDGVELVLVESQRVEQFSPGFIRARLTIQLQWQAQYGEAAA